MIKGVSLISVFGCEEDLISLPSTLKPFSQECFAVTVETKIARLC